ncbi:pyridoxal kinase [Erwinia amylovora]|uniref:pyridoxal kinase n=2 Tax=Erwinia amylovora TaxID=552 RepID=A0A830ZVM6_ERWAM|nr:pyridoxal kinase [Erwinia amylovora]EKV54409.1 pyridoxal kinase 2 / pyridoxine kinase [Erwinia amylovora ACW56400]CBA20658.1 pyridoxal kinase 2 / pyridoxine kinase [Erwinia amylovora CFBP1430]CCO78561.1 pyridoxal kinase 2 / pyridoxine kinase [Erwinia amylovora Ea356]CCO82356.1 pyridoxal kinase 2 / pyridoxine kinase [Erwinia amylovora Ea266]CCO86142.1 pyridoxal kinase 2 / pyridoxine kinase [Erwinia amylovora CFBP 2585]CCO89930.1 pyridoxal kinase 2 / pyridoxine kinase [Erwinia amylovora 01SF
MKNILSIQSHTVFGHAGNGAAEFPMRRLGANVWPLNTVQFSNHTQYGHWTGSVMPATHLTDVARGIGEIDRLKTCDAVLSGYLGSAEQGEAILEIVRMVKAANPNAWYFCDPVMGHPEKGCIVCAGRRRVSCQCIAAGQRHYRAKPAGAGNAQCTPDSKCSAGGSCVASADC